MIASSTEIGTALQVSQQVESALPQMSGAMRKIGRVLLGDPTAPLRMAITELAHRAGTSPATVTRFCRMLGYDGYVQFRVAVATDVGRAPTRIEIGTAFQPSDEPRDVLRTLLSGHVSSLQSTASGIDLEVSARIAHAIAHCRQVDLYGTGGSAVVAQEMEHRFFRIGVNTHAWADVHTGLASASMLGSSDVAIGISNSGETVETIEMLARARDGGALTVAITSHRNTPLEAVADECLLAAVPNQYLHPADLSTKHAQLLVLDFIYILVMQEDYAGAVAKLDVSAAAVATHRTLDTPKPQEAIA
ncbi:MurR/RpiR family transcriptional regulator [Pseudactinotalea suaedae]|uniref:MurR/RpiR family transcriptional regulator n=1 Tax=Pseudactinotalea suaedae TaxID=1524924 RepID=UPI001F4FE8B2|nr:MurR/RpiR family transcriptional regulator [Pseudactinotalea suaedae]